MGARFKENLIEVTDDYQSFLKRTGTLTYYKDLEDMGFQMFNVCGFFMVTQTSELLQFCEDNPNYHILTMTRPGYYENRYVPDQMVYHLANGEKNPNLVLNLFLHKNPELFLEEGFAKALAIISQVNGGDEEE